MSKRYLLRATLGVVLCLAMAQSSFGQSCKSPQGQVIPCAGSSTGAVIIVVAGVTIGAAILYVARHKPHKDQRLMQASVVGCVEKTEEGITLRNEKDNQSYGIIADTVELKNGERVELSGKKFKDRNGKLNMDVQTLVMDYGPCAP